jgi:hypothetical protein
MTVVAVVAVVGCPVLVALAYLVGRLQGEVRRLRSELQAVRPADTTRVSPDGASARSALAVDEVPAQRVAEPEVPVITAIVERDQFAELDLPITRIASITLARPLIKVVALAYGLRRALDDEHRFRVRYAMRQEFRRQRKMRRRRRSGWAPSYRWRP